jgi:hypothetical protein
LAFLFYFILIFSLSLSPCFCRCLSLSQVSAIKWPALCKGALGQVKSFLSTWWTALPDPNPLPSHTGPIHNISQATTSGLPCPRGLLKPLKSFLTMWPKPLPELKNMAAQCYCV